MADASSSLMIIIALFICCCCLLLTGGGFYWYNNIRTDEEETTSSTTPTPSSTTSPSGITKGKSSTVKSKTLNQSVWDMTDMEVDCSNDSNSVGIQGFDLGLTTDTSPLLKYDYTCANGQNVSSGGISTYSNYPVYNADGSNRISAAELSGTIFFDRQNVQCPNDTFMNKFKLSESTGNIHSGTGTGTDAYKDYKGYLYNYSCKKSDKPMSCSTYQTDPIQVTDGSQPLKSGLSEPVKCPDDSALAQFHPTRVVGQSGSSQDAMAYQYTCCKQTN